MAKVKWPLLSVEARGKLGSGVIYRRGGVVTKWFAPKNPNSLAQQAQRNYFKEFYSMGFNRTMADLLYSVIGHKHDERYLQSVPQQDHGGLSGLGDDDHGQYLTQGRGDARYLQSVPAASLTVEGKVELATSAEIDTGTDSTRAMGVAEFVGSKRNVRYIVLACIGPTTDWPADGSANVGLEFQSPIAGTMISIAANVQTAGITGTAIVDVNKNATTIMATTKLKWDSTEKSTRTYSSTAAALSVTSLAVGDLLTVDIDTNHSGTKSKGLTVIIGVRE